LQILHQILEGINVLRSTIITINNLLDLHWISICSENLLRVSKGNVLKAVNLAKAPEHGIAVFTSSLDSEHLPEVKFLHGMESEIVSHLVLGEGLCRVDREVGGDVILDISLLESLEEAELGHNVLRRSVVGMIDTLELFRSQFGEQTTWQLHTSISSASKGKESDWVSHPWLSKECVVLLQVIVEGASVPGANTSTNKSYLINKRSSF